MEAFPLNVEIFYKTLAKLYAEQNKCSVAEIKITKKEAAGASN